MFIPLWLLFCIIIVIVAVILTVRIWMDADGGGYFGDFFEALATFVIWIITILIIVALLIGKFLL